MYVHIEDVYIFGMHSDTYPPLKMASWVSWVTKHIITVNILMTFTIGFNQPSWDVDLEIH